MLILRGLNLQNQRLKPLFTQQNTNDISTPGSPIRNFSLW
jgi:hypothetical protein